MICSECYLKIKEPHATVDCPYCCQSGFEAVFKGPLTQEEVDAKKNVCFIVCVDYFRNGQSWLRLRRR